MPELLGIIAPLKKLLSDTDEVITVRVNGNNQNILQLNKNREYIIPDFQREIRWDKDNLSQLIDDIRSGSKYLGNIILTKYFNEDKYLIIDGQQRITVIIMILSCLKNIYNGKIESIEPCKLSIESFQGFEKIIENNFPDSLKEDKNILVTDKLFQINKYYELWNHMKSIDCISNKIEATKFIYNLGKSSVNIILNESDDLKDGIRYFIDVNLKGKQLDTEDIFKGYLFRNDTSQEIRAEWYKLKMNATDMEKRKVKYPLLKFLEHYFYCDLYNNKKYKSLVFDEEFLLKSEFELQEGSTTVFRMKTHLIEVINDNSYMIDSLKSLNKVIEIMIEIVDTNSPGDKFIKLFDHLAGGKKFDSDELEIFHNFMKKILKDDKVLPKALLMKYILSILIKEGEKEKKEFKKIYGVYLLAVLFMIFENKKNIDVFINVLKASDDCWYEEALKEINSYFEASKITDNKIISQFKKGTNEEEEDYRFRCKSLATIYNFFIIKDDEIIISKDLKKLKKFISDNESFTTEHFVISQKNQKLVFSKGNINEEVTYKMNEWIYKRYVNNLFNFIFISREINDKLDNYWLPKKLEIITGKDIECEYSKMIINKLEDLSNSMKKNVNMENYNKDFDLFFYQEFKEKYIEYSRCVLNSVIDKIKNKK